MATQANQINLEPLAALPIWGKILIALGLALVITGGNFYFYVPDIEKKIKRTLSDIKKNETEITNSKIIAENLTQFQREHELLKQKLAEALTALC